jgi:hypothetical protein
MRCGSAGPCDLGWEMNTFLMQEDPQRLFFCVRLELVYRDYPGLSHWSVEKDETVVVFECQFNYCIVPSTWKNL